MRIFESPNVMNDWHCPICNLNTDKQVVLISKCGTQIGNIVEGEQFHLDCLELWYYPQDNFIGMKVKY